MRSTPYELELESHAGYGPDVYRFRSADGVVSKDEFRQSELILLNSSEPRISRNTKVLNIDSNYGVVGTVLSFSAEKVVMTETSARSARLSEMNAEENGAKKASVELIADLKEVDEEFNTVVYAPKPYDPVNVVKQKILDGYRSLRADGEIYISARKDDGVKRYERVLQEIAGEENVDPVDKRGGCHVYRGIKGDDLRNKDRGEERYLTENSFEESVDNVNAEFVTHPGIFSANSLDEGTRHLIEELEISKEDRLLDVGCGYGAISVFTLKRDSCDAVLTDDDRVSTVYAEKNLKKNGVNEGSKVVTGDCLEKVNGKFDVVATNPPTHAGEDIIDEIFRGARDVLKPGGKFFLVYNEILKYDEYLSNIFRHVEVVREEDNYRVGMAVK